MDCGMEGDIESVGPGASQLDINSWLQHLPVVWPSASHLTCVSVASPEGCFEDQMSWYIPSSSHNNATQYMLDTC